MNLICPYCESKLVNYSLYQENHKFTRLACFGCYKKVILYREDYENFVKQQAIKKATLNKQEDLLEFFDDV